MGLRSSGGRSYTVQISRKRIANNIGIKSVIFHSVGVVHSCVISGSIRVNAKVESINIGF